MIRIGLLLAVGLIASVMKVSPPPGFAASTVAPSVAFKAGTGQLEILVNGQAVALYAYNDPMITRPYFAHVRAYRGAQVTRNHPPVKGKDDTDHATFHPGLWLAFGDLSGSDSWRLKAPVQHERFLEPPRGGVDRGSFVVVNRYLTNDGRRLCRETCRYTLLAQPRGLLLSWDSRFHADEGDVVFGDQEEMGLGLRMATPLTVKAGGVITDSCGHVNEKQVRGHPSDWCDYSGVIDDRRLGLLLMPHPRNFRPSWYHARDYGFVAANPFGRKSVGNGETSRVVVKRGESLRLRFGILIHSSPLDQPLDRTAAYADYVRRS